MQPAAWLTSFTTWFYVTRLREAGLPFTRLREALIVGARPTPLTAVLTLLSFLTLRVSLPLPNPFMALSLPEIADLLKGDDGGLAPVVL